MLQSSKENNDSEQTTINDLFDRVIDKDNIMFYDLFKYKYY